MTFLEARNLHKTYRLSRNNVVRALRGVDISVEAARWWHHGTVRMWQEHADAHIRSVAFGADLRTSPPPSLVIDGNDVTGLTDGERTQMRAKQMGFVFQTFNLVAILTASENVALPAEYAGWHRREARAAAAEALKLVGLEERSAHKATELSGGQTTACRHSAGAGHQASPTSGGRTYREPGFGKHERGHGSPPQVLSRVGRRLSGDPRHASERGVQSRADHDRRVITNEKSRR